ncbi:MAG: metal ABC transporter permease [Candidatus Poseidonia sp.]|nr:metal ABC transporter permease [Poseidonia sp.]MBL6886651.1 metal ABC transporter permease [Poseidonia sp.]MBL6893253.1 metal ABC transporter permease [Poseidonia sp.]
MGLGVLLLDLISPFMEAVAPVIPGEIFPYFFTMELFQRALLAAALVTIVAGILGTYLLIQHLALIGDGLAHVSFGGVAVGIVLGATSPLWYALVFSITAAILIHEMQSREMLTGDASIAIFLTGMLALGLVFLRLGGGGITPDIEGYLFGNLLLIDESSLDMITTICILSIIVISFLRTSLLAVTIDPVAARIQGLPVRSIGLLFSITTAAVVVSMVQVVGTLLVTALLVTPAATAQLVGRSFRQCLIWSQVFGLSSVLLGLYLSSELDTGSGAMIALVAAAIFAVVAISQVIIRGILQPTDNLN